MKAVIPVAGYGTRFLPFTKAIPKEMLPVVDKPVIQYLVEEVAQAGIDEIILITGSNKRAIEDHFDSYFELESKLEAAGKTKALETIRQITKLAKFIFIRQNEPLGLGHAVLQAKPAIGNEPFVVLYGDDIIEPFDDAQGKPGNGVTAQLLEVFSKHPSPILGVTEVAKNQVSQYGVIDGEATAEFGNRLYRVKDFVEKPDPEQAPSNLAISGRIILTPEIFSILESQRPGVGGEIQLTDAVRTLIKRTNGFALHYHGAWYDCGSKASYIKAVIHYALKHPEVGEEVREYIKQLT
ncbi:UTP--glucose-1-phosphate uridylyltransferase GalU [Candidatus Berkelbacteria bacterium]|nr:UTP--glucose-1-phosphate uridylyltransferase GalU [Candidatus Berkelbacteria bacterium]